MSGIQKLAIGLLFGGVVLFLALIYINSGASDTNQVFSPYTLLTSSWSKYKDVYILDEGRVIDPSQNDITTSEGQSYALLRSVWMDDRETFDKVWKWTQEILKRPEDELFGWRWGQLEDGSYGFIVDGGINAASDSDTLIALALILANRRWGEQAYLDSALKILPDLWKIETEEIGGKRYMIAGNWASDDQRIVLNPSYFAPFAWKVFAQVDSQRDWMSLVDPAYEILNTVGNLPLDKEKGVGLPPNWIEIDRQTGNIKDAREEALTTDYSYDALRVPWQIGLDYMWFQDPKALDYLQNSFTFLTQEYQDKQMIHGTYTHDGIPLNELEHPLMYATSLGYLVFTNPNLAKTIYEDKILSLYADENYNFNEDLGYYEQNWLWFGAAMYNKQLFNYEAGT